MVAAARTGGLGHGSGSLRPNRPHHTGQPIRASRYFRAGRPPGPRARIIRPVTGPQPATPLRLVILDMDGVLYRGDQPIPGAADLARRLHGAGVEVRYATNNSMFTRAAYAERLRSMASPRRPTRS